MAALCSPPASGAIRGNVSGKSIEAETRVCPRANPSDKCRGRRAKSRAPEFMSGQAHPRLRIRPAELTLPFRNRFAKTVHRLGKTVIIKKIVLGIVAAAFVSRAA